MPRQTATEIYEVMKQTITADDIPVIEVALYHEGDSTYHRIHLTPAAAKALRDQLTMVLDGVSHVRDGQVLK